MGRRGRRSPAMRRFSSRPLGQANGQDDLTIRLLLLRLRLDTRTADELEAVVHAVQEQPHVPHDELADAALRRLLRVLFRKIGVDVRLRLCHVELLADDGLQHGQPVLLLRQPQQRPRVPLRELVLPQHGQHLRAVAQQAQLVRHGALTFTHTLGRLPLTQTIQAHEPRQPLGLLDVVEVAPLEVLHQRDHAALRLVHRQQDVLSEQNR